MLSTFPAVAVRAEKILEAFSLALILRTMHFRNTTHLVYYFITFLFTLAILISCGSNRASGTAYLQQVASGLTSPITLQTAPDTGNHLIVDQIGLIRVMKPDGTIKEQPFLDLRHQMTELRTNFDERGLLGLALHPDYRENGRFFVYYSAPLRNAGPAGWDHTTHISEFQRSASNPDRADPESEKVLLQIDMPQFNHNGGNLLIGPGDGYLYIGVGDGGAGNDRGPGHNPQIGNGQDVSNLLGNILRIDINSESENRPYGIPEDNPFVTREGFRDEIYAYGFRNPWGISIDGQTGQFIAADVGQDLFESVNLIVNGGNYGWFFKEGMHCFDPDNPGQPPETCRDFGLHQEPLLDPILEYKNARGFSGDADAEGISIIGGHLYRGSVKYLQGKYIFGDWSRDIMNHEGRLFVAEPRAGGDTESGNAGQIIGSEETAWQMKALNIEGAEDGVVPAFILGFAVDQDHELYIMTTENRGPSGNTGKIFRLDSR